MNISEIKIPLSVFLMSAIEGASKEGNRMLIPTYHTSMKELIPILELCETNGEYPTNHQLFAFKRGEIWNVNDREWILLDHHGDWVGLIAKDVIDMDVDDVDEFILELGFRP